VKFTLPKVNGSSEWDILIDTNVPDGLTQSFHSGDTYDVTGRSLLLFQLKPAAATPASPHP
jgi:isoamylase